jgi:hypothetical protein
VFSSRKTPHAFPDSTAELNRVLELEDAAARLSWMTHLSYRLQQPDAL